LLPLTVDPPNEAPGQVLSELLPECRVIGLELITANDGSIGAVAGSLGESPQAASSTAATARTTFFLII
jgi:hypothetical protein